MIVGFACYNKSRDDDLLNCGEIYAIYVLKKYHMHGVGKKLMEACYKKLEEFRRVAVWVLKSNLKSINFYKHLGFIVDGKEKVIKVSNDTELHEIRLIKNF
jgi:ribosomal protein S18 acetylase RimI-like enzyme